MGVGDEDSFHVCAKWLEKYVDPNVIRRSVCFKKIKRLKTKQSACCVCPLNVQTFTDLESAIKLLLPLQFPSTILYDPARKKEPTTQYQKERDKSLGIFTNWNDDEQVEFVEQLLSRMCHYQHGHINAYLKPMLQRDFISLLPKKGLDHVADNILSYLDADSLFAAELVSKEWNRVISEGMLWKKLIERKVRSDSLWRGLAERKKWIKYLFVPRPGEYRNHSFYRQLYPVIMKVKT